MRLALAVALVAAVLAMGVVVFYLVAARRAGPPPELGVRNGRLAPCPDTPNCVSTQSTEPSHRMDPIPYTGPRVAARDRLLAVVRRMPRTTVETAEEGYLHVVFRSAFFRFPDDVEFYLDDGAKTVHFRSASRLGHYDLDVNRKRMEAIGTAVRSKE